MAQYSRTQGKTIARPNRTISKRERSTRNERRVSSPCLAWRDLINRTLITESSRRENSRSARLFSTKSAALPVSMRLISCLSLFEINARYTYQKWKSSSRLPVFTLHFVAFFGNLTKHEIQIQMSAVTAEFKCSG